MLKVNCWSRFCQCPVSSGLIWSSQFLVTFWEAQKQPSCNPQRKGTTTQAWIFEVPKYWSLVTVEGCKLFCVEQGSCIYIPLKSDFTGRSQILERKDLGLCHQILWVGSGYKLWTKVNNHMTGQLWVASCYQGDQAYLSCLCGGVCLFKAPVNHLNKKTNFKLQEIHSVSMVLQLYIVQRQHFHFLYLMKRPTTKPCIKSIY